MGACLTLAASSAFAASHGEADTSNRASRKMFVYRGPSSTWAVSAEGGLASAFVCACFAVDDQGPKCVLSTPTQTEAQESKTCDERKCSELFGRGFYTSPAFCVNPAKVFYPAATARRLSDAEAQKVEQGLTSPNPSAGFSGHAVSAPPSKSFVPTSPFPTLDPKKTNFPF